DAVDLLLERRRHRCFDVGGARADERRRHLDHRRYDVGILGDRQAAHRHHAHHDEDDRQHHRDDRTVDEETGHRAYFAWSAGGAAVPSAGSGFVRTSTPSRSACSPSATTRSPGDSPSSTTHSVSTRGPTVTFLKATLLSAPTTATERRFCSSWTARCGTSSAPRFMSSSMRARPYWPGRSTLSGFGNAGFSVRVP